ncbi:MAG: DUF5320 domain-containing protein [Candidatus Hatepunaea meridiana]|nr:DUF5320 domain-containing protein [Candidatus Hatepunaea meridiana]
MPYGDRTGPAGAGPMTGRQAGYCVGFDRPGSANPGRGFGFGMGRGGGFGGHGRGWRNQYQATGLPGWARGGRFFGQETYPPNYATEIPREEELRALKSQSNILENSLSELKKRITELEGATGE